MPQSYRWANVPFPSPGTKRVACWRRLTGGQFAVAETTPILLLRVTYGLRAHEIAKRTPDDIDWKRERLQIPERKAGHWTAYPLAKVVGDALVRPQTQDERRLRRPSFPAIDGNLYEGPPLHSPRGRHG
jgi:hypothetical protein